MPVLGITTPIEFAAQEWDKLARGWKQLNPSDRDKRLQEHLNELRARGELALYPEIPGWDDILKLGRAPTGLTKAQLEERRKLVVARINKSVTPLSQKGLSSILNAIDDVQDLTSLTGLISRLIIRAAPRLLGRAVPVVGWIATASDVLNFLTFLTSASAAIVGLGEEGPLGAVAAEAGPAFVKVALKRELWRSLRRAPYKAVRPSATIKQLEHLFSKEYKLPPQIAQKYAHLIGRRVGVGELLEAAQASQTLTGYGLSLGAIMGYLSDFAWATFREIGPVRFPIYEALAREIGKQAPYEFYLSKPDQPELAVNWSLIIGPGPAAYDYKDPAPNPNFATLGPITPMNSPSDTLNACAYLLWTKHPRYPSIPASVVMFQAFRTDEFIRFYQATLDFLKVHDLELRVVAAVGHR